MIKKLWVGMLAGLLIVSCAAINAELNIDKQMKGYVFHASPEPVYKAAADVFQSLNKPLTSIGKNKGISPWEIEYRDDGGLSRWEDVRFNVEVNTIGENQSTVRIMREAKPRAKTGHELMDRYITIRSIGTEYMVLEAFDPSEAKILKKKASEMPIL